MVPQWIIEAKRDGKELAEADIRAFIKGYTAGDIPDYQMSALAMAIFFQGMTHGEVCILTDAMMRSGNTLDFTNWPQPTADKHSTGGIGDKVSLLLAPMVACCGVTVPMLSGRGLGITGGTLDKLESIPGYQTHLDESAFRDVLRTCGCSIMGQTDDLAPADRKLYALRDVTGTVPSIPLIAASIMSKKLAEGASTLVLDVKFGCGAFMKTKQSAHKLAQTMLTIGTALGRHMHALLTDMNQPLGCAAGNAVEVAETIAALQGDGPADLMDVTFACGEAMLTGSGSASTRQEARSKLAATISSGDAFDRFCRMVNAHGGDTNCLQRPELMMPGIASTELPAPRAGVVSAVDAERVGRAIVILGGGRQQITDTVDPAVGVTGLVKNGDTVDAGQPLMTVWADDTERRTEALEMLASSVDIKAEATTPPPLIAEELTPNASARKDEP